jgi:hypothetical protein
VEEGEWRRGRRRKWAQFGAKGGHQRTTTWRSKRWRTRYGDDGSSKANEVIRVGGGSCGGERWCVVRVNPNYPPPPPNRQRPSARIMGLDGRAKLLSGGGGRGAAPRKEKEAGMVRRQRRSPEDKHVEEQEVEDKIRR